MAEENCYVPMEIRRTDTARTSGPGSTTEVLQYNVPMSRDAHLNPKTFLTSPDVSPQTFGLHANVIANSGITQLFFSDADGMCESLGLVGGAKAQEMDYLGELFPSDIKHFLQTHALIVISYNFESSNPNVIKNNLRYVRGKADGDDDKRTLFSAQTKSNMQEITNLLNIGQAFVWTADTALKLSILAPTVDTTVDFTFSFLAAVPYGDLDSWLAAAQIPVQNRALTGGL